MPLFRRRSAIKLATGWNSFHPVMARLYASRGAKPSEIQQSLAKLAPASGMRGIEHAAGVIAMAVKQNRRITIVGDYDADGCTGTCVGLLALKMMGCTAVDFLIPDRVTMGYGLSPTLAEMAHDRGAELLLTVDNGIASFDGVARARALGMEVVVTDHHLAPPVLPDATAIVNPNQPGCPFPSKNMAGVGVMFSTMLAVRKQLREENWFQALYDPNLSLLLDLVAIGTIADVVKLDNNNRILVQAGLERMRSGPLRPGLKALFEVAKIDPAYLMASDVAFKLAPRINAAGRLEHMSAGIECLISEDLDMARSMALSLDDLNRARKEIQADMQDDANALMIDVPKDVVGLALFEPMWREGVVGLVAGRIKEAHYKPVVAFAKAHEEGLLKGSARSIPGIHIRDVLANVQALNPGLILKMGGHAMAAGLTIPESRLADFQHAFDSACRAASDPDMLEHVVETDGPLSPHDLTLELARSIETGGPWGQGFTQPLFEGRFLIKRAFTMGKDKEHVRYNVTDGVNEISAVHFGGAEQIRTGGHIDLVFQPTINRWQGREDVQLLVEHAE